MEDTNYNGNSNDSDARATISTGSPEFEFWMLRNPSSQQTTLHSADELFSGGILLPLHLLTIDDPPDTAVETTNTPTITPDTESIHGSDLKTTFTTTASKRWKDIFKKNSEEKKKKKERNVAAVGAATPELNINLWPFSRSRSAGSRPRTVVGNRKVSSAPCSRSNSTGDKYRRWPTSPARPGVHLGRSSPVWQAKRFGQSRSLHDGLFRNAAEKGSRPTKGSTTGAGANGMVLNTNVPTCIGYRERMSCQSDVTNSGCVTGGIADVTPVSAGGEGGATGLFSFRGLFTKKVF